MNKLSYKDLEKNNLLLYKYIKGSTLYNLTVEGSDIDYGGVYCTNINQILGLGYNYQDQITNETNDIIYYELKKYLHLLSCANPNILESLYVPEDKIIGDVHPCMRKILDLKDLFLTKECFQPFVGYAVTQIKKARGLNKKVFQVVSERKDILDFCYTFSKQGSILLKEYLSNNNMEQEYCGLVNIPNMRDIYGLYYDYDKTLHYKGIMKNGDTESNEVRLSSVKNNAKPIIYISFNKDGYIKHCKDYKEYKDWESKRNKVRYNTTMKSGKGYDAKNMFHCVRLMHMAKEIALGEGFNVVRTHDREFLLDIRKGLLDYDYLIDYVDKLKVEIDELIPKSNLPEKVDVNLLDDLLIDVRKSFI